MEDEKEKGKQGIEASEFVCSQIFARTEENWEGKIKGWSPISEIKPHSEYHSLEQEEEAEANSGQN